MALGTGSTQVTWDSGSNSKSVAGAGAAESDVLSFSGDEYGAKIQCKAEHSGTPGTDDYVDFWLLESLGDPDGTGSDEYASSDETHPMFLGRADMNTSDPAVIVRDIPAPLNKAKLRAVNNAGESVTVSAEVLEGTG